MNSVWELISWDFRHLWQSLLKIIANEFRRNSQNSSNFLSTSQSHMPWNFLMFLWRVVENPQIICQANKNQLENGINFIRKCIWIISEYALSASETNQIEHLTNGALVTLGHYCLQRMQWTRFGKLLLTLRCLSLRPFDMALKQLFNHIIGDVIESKWKIGKKTTNQS